MTVFDSELILRIVDRAQLHFPDRERRHIYTDIVAVIAGGVPLRLEDWLAADDFNFVHDIVGIERHLNRQTFQLMQCFTPRFAQRTK